MKDAPWVDASRRVHSLARNRDPWERQPGEGQKAYARFSIYLEMGPLARSLRAVARQVSIGLGMIERLSTRWQWVFRVEQHDGFQERQRREVLRREQDEMLRRHANLALLVLQKVVARLRGGKDRSLTPEGVQQEVPVSAMHPDELSAGDVARWADVAVRIERLARGLPTEHAEITGRVSTGHETDDLARRVLSDPRATAMVADLFALLASDPGPEPGAAGASGVGDLREPAKVEDHASPGSGEPGAT